MKRDRQRERPDQQTERVFHLPKTGRVRLVIVAVSFGFEAPLAEYPVEDESDDERREDEQKNDHCDHIKILRSAARRRGTAAAR